MSEDVSDNSCFLKNVYKVKSIRDPWFIKASYDKFYHIPIEIFSLMAAMAVKSQNKKKKLSILDPCNVIGASFYQFMAKNEWVDAQDKCTCYGKDLLPKDFTFKGKDKNLMVKSVEAEIKKITETPPKAFDAIVSVSPILVRIERGTPLPYDKDKAHVPTSPFLFIEYLLPFLANNGIGLFCELRLSSFSYEKNARIRKRLIELNYIDAVINIPCFKEGDKIKEAVIYALRKNKKDDKILMINVSGMQANNLKQNLGPAIKKALHCFLSRKEEIGFSVLLEPSKVIRGHVLSPSEYVGDSSSTVDFRGGDLLFSTKLSKKKVKVLAERKVFNG